MIAITDALGSSLVVYTVFLERPRRTLQAREGEPGWVRDKESDLLWGVDFRFFMERGILIFREELLICAFITRVFFVIAWSDYKIWTLLYVGKGGSRV